MHISPPNSSCFTLTIVNPSWKRKMRATLCRMEPRMTEAQHELKYDNFFSPENHSFYANFNYADLEETKKEFRLLRVHPTNSNDAAISCELLDQIRLEDVKGKYSTVSYC